MTNDPKKQKINWNSKEKKDDNSKRNPLISNGLELNQRNNDTYITSTKITKSISDKNKYISRMYESTESFAETSTKSDKTGTVKKK